MNHAQAKPRLNWWQPASAALPSTAASRDAVAPGAAAEGPRLPFYALGVFSFVMVVAPQDLIPGLAMFRPAMLAGVVALIALLSTRAGRAQAAAAYAPEFGIALALLAWAVLMVPLSYWPGGSVDILTDRLGKSLIACWLIGVTVSSASRLRTMFWLLSACAMPIALTALVHFATGVVDPRTGNRIFGYGNGLAANPNDLALMLAIVLPLTMSLASSAARRSTRWLATAMATLEIAAIVVTFSRGGFLTLAVILMLFAWHRFRRAPISTAAFALAAIVIALPLMPTGFADRLATVTDIKTDPTGSAQDRWRDTVLAAQFLREHPFIGAGLGNDMLALNDMRRPTWRNVHNAYLNYGVDLGLPGLVLFLWLLIRCTRAARRTARLATSTDHREVGLLARGVAIGLMGFAVAAFFYPVAYHFYFYYLAGLAIAARRLG
jgi:putative inorganic carbon (HCO3(-)) transporter